MWVIPDPGVSIHSPPICLPFCDWFGRPQHDLLSPTPSSCVQDLDVEGDGMQGPPSPLQFDTALALEDQTIRAIAEAPMDLLTGGDPDLEDSTGPELSEGDMDAIIQDQVNSLLGTYHSLSSPPPHPPRLLGCVLIVHAYTRNRKSESFI